MDRDVVNALHYLYQKSPMAPKTLLSRLWCGSDTTPDIEALTQRDGGRYQLSPELIGFIKAVEGQLANLPPGEFMFGYPISQPPRKKGEPRPAFVAMPYGKDWFTSVKKVILSSAKAAGFDAEVSKDLSKPGSIPNQIWHGIRRADVVLADITGNNPNVFYELGLAHALGKEVILISQSTKPSPFDISTSRLLRYNRKKLPALRKELDKAFAAVSPRYPYEDPKLLASPHQRIQDDC